MIRVSAGENCWASLTAEFLLQAPESVPAMSAAVASHHPAAATALPRAPRGSLRFDRRLLLVYGLLLLDVVVIGSTSLQHVWQPANLIDKVLQNHNMPPDSTGMAPPQLHLPIAVKRELGMSCCCGWLALAVMGTLSLLLSYSPSAIPSNSEGSLSSAAPSTPLGADSTAATPTGRRRLSTLHSTETTGCNNCRRTFDEMELQVKLKYLLVAVATFCVFFALNLVVQIHGRFQQSKVTATALKTFTANRAGEVASSVGPGLCTVRRSRQEALDFHEKRLLAEVSDVSTAALADAAHATSLNEIFKPAAEPAFQEHEEAGVPMEDIGAAHPQSPPYFYWRDVFFWLELGRGAEWPLDQADEATERKGCSGPTKRPPQRTM
ncbi:hypothetical protein Esti_000043 [Eimeria stiedai]